MGEKEIDIPGISGRKAIIGRNTSITDTGSRSLETKLQVKTGSEVIDSFSVDTSISGTFSAISVSAGASYSYESSVKRDETYAFISSNSERYSAYILYDGIFNNLNKDFLRAARSLPNWSDKNPPMEEYKRFFEIWGTHVIQKGHLGSRYQLKVQTSNIASTDKESFGASVEVNYAKILSSKANTDGKKVEERYKNSVQGEAVVIGGSEEKNKILAHNNNDETAFKEWAKSRGSGENETITHIQVDSIGDFLSLSEITEHRDIGKRLQAALQALLLGPKPAPIRLEGWVTANSRPPSVSMETWGASVSIHLQGLVGTSAPTTHDKQFTLRPTNENELLFVRLSAGITVKGFTQKQVTIAKWTEDSEVWIKLYPQGVEGAIYVRFPEGSNKVVLPSLTAVGSYTAH